MNTLKTQRSKGFTLIELIVVIVILGILAGIAIPRYIDQTQKARIAAITGVYGAINSAVALAKGAYKMDSSSTTITADDTSFVVNTSGYPIAAATGIGAAVHLQGFSVSTTTNADEMAFDFSPTVENCNVTYDAATGSATLNTSGC